MFFIVSVITTDHYSQCFLLYWDTTKHTSAVLSPMFYCLGYITRMFYYFYKDKKYFNFSRYVIIFPLFFNRIFNSLHTSAETLFVFYSCNSSGSIVQGSDVCVLLKMIKNLQYRYKCRLTKHSKC